MHTAQVLCFTLLSETSPQALPLGAACVLSALKNSPLTAKKARFSLDFLSLEDEFFTSCKNDEQKAEKLALRMEKLFPNCKIFCLSVYVWNRSILDLTVKLLKKRLSSSVFIAGGPEATANPHSFFDYDYAVSGEGEKAMPLLVESILLGKEICTIRGVYKNKNESKSQNDFSLKEGNFRELYGEGFSIPPKIDSNRAETADLSTLSSPYLDGTLDLKKFGGALWELARGCPFKCSYCYESKGENCVRYYNLERLYAELDFFKKQNISQVFVLDPTYNADKKRALQLLREIKKRTQNIFFHFEGRAEFLDKDIAVALASFPCSMQFGLQSAHKEVLKNVHRSFDKARFVKNISLLNRSGAIFGFDLIYGLPGDSFAGFKESIDFAISLRPNNLELFCLSVLPGTKLFEEAFSLGLVWLAKPPYTVVSTKTFSENDLKMSEQLSKAVSVFYTLGKAVPWFLSVLRLTGKTASAFFESFADFAGEKLSYIIEDTCENFDVIEKMQIDFVQKMLSKKKNQNTLDIALDLIRLNGALGRCTAYNVESTVSLHYHPDDLMSGYAEDILTFAQIAGRQKCKARVFMTKNGADWATV